MLILREELRVVQKLKSDYNMYMKIFQALQKIRTVQYLKNSPPVLKTVSQEIISKIPSAKIQVKSKGNIKSGAGNFYIGLYQSDIPAFLKKIENSENFIYFEIYEDGSGSIVVSKPNLLFWFVSLLFDQLQNHDIKKYRDGILFTPSFKWQRISYDFFLTQEGRIQKGLNKETYIKQFAMLGFTHMEVNGLVSPMALETGPKGETYPMFYTYCPALDQFVYSRLNKGLYPEYYLSANLNNLKENARLAKKYGLTPGLLCFEPRSVPEEFFNRYPMLRGARVDHPFRSFKPRYNMTITHPKVREHYAEMMQKLMKEVPELGYMCIWTNDSGAGFEHTKSLYVGRNGGAYMIREWRDDEAIAKCAGENAIRFFKVLKDAGQTVNPDFRILTRLESFYGEQNIVWDGLGKGIDVETASLVAKGWEMPYNHPKYPDSNSVSAGTIYQNKFNKRESVLAEELKDKGACAHFYFAAGPHTMFAPLIGIPYPTLTYKRLKLLHRNRVQYLAHSGGSHPPELVPFNINHHVCRLFQLNSTMNIKWEIANIARRWAGEKYYATLLKAWDQTEEAILFFPNITSLYSSMGFTWYRLWVRPLIPNIEALSQRQRDYYENFMCTTPHNPNNVDLSRDVLFQLTTAEKCRIAIDRIDQNLWGPLTDAIDLLTDLEREAQADLGVGNIIYDQLIRLKALKCWFRTQRSVAAWITGVYGYMESKKQSDKSLFKKIIMEMVEQEIANTEELLILWNSGVEFMATTELGETPLIHGRNLPDLWKKRIRFMSAHIDDEPYIDMNYIENKAGEIFI